MDASVFDASTDGDTTVAELVGEMPEDVKTVVRILQLACTGLVKVLCMILAGSACAISFGLLPCWMFMFWLQTQLLWKTSLLWTFCFDEQQRIGGDLHLPSDRADGPDKGTGEQDKGSNTSQLSKAHTTQVPALDHSAEQLNLFEAALNSSKQSRQFSNSPSQPLAIAPDRISESHTGVTISLLDGVQIEDNIESQRFNDAIDRYDGASAASDADNAVDSKNGESHDGCYDQLGGFLDQWYTEPPHKQATVSGATSKSVQSTNHALSEREQKELRQAASQTTWIEDMKRGRAQEARPRQSQRGSNWADPHHFRPASNDGDTGGTKTSIRGTGFTQEQLAEAANFAQQATRGGEARRKPVRPSHVPPKTVNPSGAAKKPVVHKAVAPTRLSKQPVVHQQQRMINSNPLRAQRSSSPPKTLPPHLRKANAAKMAAQSLGEIEEARTDHPSADNSLKNRSVQKEGQSAGPKYSQEPDDTPNGQLAKPQAKIGHKHFGSMTSFTTIPEMAALTDSVSATRADQSDIDTSHSSNIAFLNQPVNKDMEELIAAYIAEQATQDDSAALTSNYSSDEAPPTTNASTSMTIEEMRDINTSLSPRYGGVSANDVREFQCMICKRWARSSRHNTPSICFPCHVVGVERIEVAKGVITGTVRKVPQHISIAKSTELSDAPADEVSEFAQSKPAFAEDSGAESDSLEESKEDASLVRPAEKIFAPKKSTSSLTPTALPFVAPVSSGQRSISQGSTETPALTTSPTLASDTPSPAHDKIHPSLSTHASPYHNSGYTTYGSSHGAHSWGLSSFAPQNSSLSHVYGFPRTYWSQATFPYTSGHETSDINAMKPQTSNETEFDSYSGQSGTHPLNPNSSPFVTQYSSAMLESSPATSGLQKSSKAIPIMQPQKPDSTPVLRAMSTSYEKRVPALPAATIRDPPGLNRQDGMKPEGFDVELLKIGNEGLSKQDPLRKDAPSSSKESIKYRIQELKDYGTALEKAKNHASSLQADASTSVRGLQPSTAGHAHSSANALSYADGSIHPRFLFGRIGPYLGQEHPCAAGYHDAIVVQPDTNVAAGTTAATPAASTANENHMSDSSTAAGIDTGSSLPWKKKKKAARASLKDAWKAREEIRARVVGTWTLDGARALEEATKNYMSERADLAGYMASGELNEEDAKVFPALAKADLSQPKYRP